MAKLIKLFIINVLNKWVEDLFMLVGIGFLVYTTYSINITAGNYLVGAVFLLFGFLMAKK
ncbi:hypothetical protein [Metabacillus litoralis]|uniref:hypothetical protein n=1 Tax=Metabacillus litoralis TaxID=152268 RepID=UPI0020417DD6|nr:hypothetical protein [Metabacillus litoralis]MCM3411237.1 hypothetical protein [Metabacillus litoralis]